MKDGVTTPINMRMPMSLFERVEGLRSHSRDRRSTKTDIILDLIELGLKVIDSYQQLKSPEAIELLNQKMDSVEIVDILDRLDERTFRALYGAVSDTKLMREARQRKAIQFRSEFEK
jgi:hypothetical protein